MHESDKMSSNPYEMVGRNVVESMFYHFSYKLDKRFSIKRLKVLGATTFEGTINPIDMEKWLSLIEKCLGVMDCPKERNVKLATFSLQASVED